MPISYVSKVNKRAIGSEVTIVNESHVVGIVGVNTVASGQVKLVETPLKEVPSTVIIPGLTEITTGSPGALEFLVDYVNGRITFNVSKDSDTVFVTYKGRGTVIDAVDVNELQQPVGVALNLDGTLSPGIVRPVNISTNISDDFTFPNDVIVTGDLTVNGTTTTLNTETVTIEDNIILLNSNIVGAPTVDAGFEIERGSSANVKLIWNETDDAWELQDTSGSPIIKALDTGVVEISTLLISDVGSNANLTFDIDKDNNGSGSEFRWRTDNSSVLMTLNESGNLSLPGNVLTTGSGTVNSEGGVVSNQLTGRTVGVSIRPFSNLVEAVKLQNAAGSTTVLDVDTVNNRVGVNTVTPAASFHNSGSTVFGVTTASDPASILATIVDDNTGINITSTIAVSVTLPTPTDTTIGRFFTVLHNDTSTGTLSVDGSNIGVGKGSTFIWDSSAWIPVGTTGGFEVLSSDPGSPVEGDTWYNSTDSQFKGQSSSGVVILG